MNINKKYKLNKVTNKDLNSSTNSIHVFEDQEKKHWAVASNSYALAKVPVILEENELSRGNSIKSDDFEFQSKNPALKKKLEMFCFLSQPSMPFPKLDHVFPSGDPKATIVLDVKLLCNLADALGTDRLKFEIIDSEKAIRVFSTKSEAVGLIMPIKLR